MRVWCRDGGEVDVNARRSTPFHLGGLEPVRLAFTGKQ